ncbi:hypothetical protein [Nisaea sp.]|uniref:hypothetical protein n=1 Tax=Nisaea sp. TaxID=2024842 RepID=UPI002B26A8F1|nr:hypothetical protein [Nisaea sp.]
MFNIRYAAMLIGGLLIGTFMVGTQPANAGIYVCTDGDCNTWAAITTNQKNETPGRSAGSTCKKDVTVQKALAGANDNRIANAIAGTADWNIYLKSSLWHNGGAGVPSCNTHVTGYLYKNDEHKTTCHVLAFYNTEKNYWITTCN